MAKEKKRCKERVYSSYSFTGHPCSFNAKPGSDYCGHHDPKAKAARAAKRGPTKWEREQIASENRRKRLRNEVREEVATFLVVELEKIEIHTPETWKPAEVRAEIRRLAAEVRGQKEPAEEA